MTHVATATTAIDALVVDDEALVRWTLRDLLEQRGCRVREAGTAAGARAGLAAAPDLVLLDVRLPDGDGLDLLRQVRATAPDTPVILMSAYSGITTAAQAMGLGAYDLLHKPFNLDEAARQVAKGIETSLLRRDARARAS